MHFCKFLDSDSVETAKAKPQKRRAPLLLKRKALTTGFFDSSKIKSDGNKASNTSGLVFGQPLEKCLSNDISKLTAKQGGNDRSGRSSRSSISSLLDGQFGTPGSTGGKEAVSSECHHDKLIKLPFISFFFSWAHVIVCLRLVAI